MTAEGEVALVTRALEDVAAPADTPGEVQELVTASGVAMVKRKQGQNKINSVVVTEAPAEPLPGEEPHVSEAPAARSLLTLPVLK